MPELHRNHRLRSQIGTRRAQRRTLQFDRLEERRLFAGLVGGTLDVVLFDDPQSARQMSADSRVVPERVVYLDLNGDGAYQDSEPFGITDARGNARFDGLEPGSYAVRLLGGDRTTLMTTGTQPAPAGEWLANLDASHLLKWETDSIAWLVTSDTIEQWNLDTLEQLQSIPFRGEILSTAMVGEERGMAVVRRGTVNELVAFSWASDARNESMNVRTLPIAIRNMDQLLAIGDSVWVHGATANGSGLYRVQMDRDQWNSSAPSVDALPAIDGFVDGVDLRVIGDDVLIASEPSQGGTRISSYKLSQGRWELVAERSFEGRVQYSSGRDDGMVFAVETLDGVLILSNTTGLPNIELLGAAAGPTVFDASRGLLMTRSARDPSRIMGWSTGDGALTFDVLFTRGASGNATIPMTWSMGFRNDALIGIRDGAVYRHRLNIASPTEAIISEGVLRQVAIGIRSIGTNRSPSLQALPDFTMDEDGSLAIPRETFLNASRDEDNDSLYYFVRRQGSLGELVWSESFATYVPSPDANGIDRWTIQAFDGSDWSSPQVLTVNVTPVNDLPSGIRLQETVSVAEMQSGADLTGISVIDSDSDAEYRYVISDGRFYVSGGVLRLQPGVSLDYEATPLMVLSITALDVKSGDSVRGQVTVQVLDRNDAPIGMVLTGSGAVPENVAGYVVGNVNVIDPDRSEVYDVSVSDPRFEVAGNVVRVKPGNSIQYVEPGWIDLSFLGVSRTTGDTVERTERVRVIKDETPYHNDQNPMDVDGDGYVTPLDPLIIINYINSHGSGPITQGEGESGIDLDVDGDGHVSPLDILIVINAINEQRSNGGNNGGNNGSGEGGTSGGGSNPLPPGEGEGRSAAPVVVPPLFQDDLDPRRKRIRG